MVFFNRFRQFIISWAYALFKLNWTMTTDLHAMIRFENLLLHTITQQNAHTFNKPYSVFSKFETLNSQQNEHRNVLNISLHFHATTESLCFELRCQYMDTASVSDFQSTVLFVSTWFIHYANLRIFHSMLNLYRFLGGFFFFGETFDQINWRQKNYLKLLQVNYSHFRKQRRKTIIVAVIKFDPHLIKILFIEIHINRTEKIRYNYTKDEMFLLGLFGLSEKRMMRWSICDSEYWYGATMKKYKIFFFAPFFLLLFQMFVIINHWISHILCRHVNILIQY